MHTRLIPALALLGVVALAQAQTPDVFKGHTDSVNAVAFSPDGKVLATGSSDNTVKLWDFSNGKPLHSLEGHKKQIYSLAFSKNYLASGSADTTIRLWNPKDGKFVRELKGHTDVVQALAFDSEGKILASCGAGKDKSVRLWNPEDGKEIKKLGDHKGSVYWVAFSPDGKQLASCGQEGIIKIWDVADKKELKTLEVILGKDDKGKDKVSKEDILRVVFTPDGKKLISGGNDKVIRVWDLEEGKEVKKLTQPDIKKSQYIYGLALSKDGKKVVAAGYGGNVYVWDLDSGKVEFKDEKKGTGNITFDMVLTPDETRIVTAQEKSPDPKVKGGIAKVTKIESK